MHLNPGTRLGSYEVIQLLGEGGMGRVYRARDNRLRRDVALKMLPDDLRLSPERRARFEHEARVVAALNHPNIAAIYGIEDGAEGIQALVLELVEGKTLATRISEGPLSIAEALTIARQIAEALDEAHEKGVVHRDLKPANIVITPTGLVKVLDFGIAKMTDPAAPMSSDTVTAGLTRDGVIVGTPAYMSPEQARGQFVDKRTDVWAFGCVLYEMLTGARAFAGPSSTDTLAAILEREPDWSSLPTAVPPPVVTLLRRCLDKDRKRRLRDIGEARITLEAPGAGQQTPATDRSLSAPRSWRTASALFVALFAMSYAAWTWRTPRADSDIGPAPSRTVFTLEPPVGEEFGKSGDEEPVPVASPDSTKLLFRTGGRIAPRWWIRSFDSATSVPFDAAFGAPFVWWAPDSHQVVWCVRSKTGESELWTAPLTGGARRLTGDCNPGRGASWGTGGVIIFAADDSRSLRQVKEGGGDSTPLTELDPSHPERRLSWPAFLPDGKHYVFLVTESGSADAGIYLGEIGSVARVRLVPERSRPVIVPRPDGGVDLVFVQRRKLIAQQIDVPARKLVGEPQVLAPDVSMGLTSFTGAYTASASLLAYRAGGHTSDADGLKWFDRRGNQVGAVASEKGLIASVALRRDGRRLLYAKFDPDADTISIWEHDLERQVPQLMLHDDKNYLSYSEPAWSPDGQSFIYMSNESGNWTIHEFWPEIRRDETLAPGTVQQYPSTERVVGATTTEYFTLSRADGSRARLPLPAGAGQPRVSPDGRSVAFSWTGTGQSGTAYDIYIQSLPPSGVPVRLSTTGGFDPEWSRDGHELNYLTPDGSLVAAHVDPRDPTRPGPQERLFSIKKPNNDPLQPGVIGLSHFAPSADGQRFLMIPFRMQQPVTVVMNWRQP